MQHQSQWEEDLSLSGRRRRCPSPRRSQWCRGAARRARAQSTEPTAPLSTPASLRCAAVAARGQKHRMSHTCDEQRAPLSAARIPSSALLLLRARSRARCSCSSLASLSVPAPRIRIASHLSLLAAPCSAIARSQPRPQQHTCTQSVQQRCVESALRLRSHAAAFIIIRILQPQRTQGEAPPRSRCALSKPGHRRSPHRSLDEDCIPPPLQSPPSPPLLLQSPPLPCLLLQLLLPVLLLAMPPPLALPSIGPWVTPSLGFV